MGTLPPPAAIPSSLGVLAAAGARPPPPLLPAARATAQAQPGQPGVAASPAGQQQVGLPVQIQVPAGLFLGEGFLPLPQRLVDRITRLEYVEMSELLPETWLLDDTLDSKCCHATPKRRKAPVTDILTWVQCFASLASVLSRMQQEQTPGLMAYMSTIVRCHKEFEGLGWVQYDAAFRRQMAVSRDLNWGKINATLYSIYFAGHARRLPRCKQCLSTNHPSEDCPQAPAFQHLLIPPINMPPYGQAWPPQRQWQPQPPSAPDTRQRASVVELCMLFNNRAGPRCTFPRCKYAHLCLNCREGHPAAHCPKRQASHLSQSAEPYRKRPRPAGPH